MEFIEQDATGRFQLTPATQFEGPFEKPVTIPMQNALLIKPVHDAYTQNGRICGTCHTIHLPVLDAKSEPEHSDECHLGKFSYEQATYLEWVNSGYQNVIDSAKNLAIHYNYRGDQQIARQQGQLDIRAGAGRGGAGALGCGAGEGPLR